PGAPRRRPGAGAGPAGGGLGHGRGARARQGWAGRGGASRLRLRHRGPRAKAARARREALGGGGAMGNVAVVGAQWGDEGKGKIVDWLSERADVVVRFQGGANAGHTLVIGNIEYKLALLPSGVARPGKLSIIGNGVVVDPWALLAEIEAMRKKGLDISPDNLRVADSAALILPSHGTLDLAREESRGEKKIGTTGRGIGPAYEDKVGRRAIRLCDLSDAKFLDDRIDDLLLHHNALLRGLGAAEVDRG